MSGSISSVLLTDDKRNTVNIVLSSKVKQVFVGMQGEKRDFYHLKTANRVTIILVFVSPACKNQRNLVMKVVTATKVGLVHPFKDVSTPALDLHSTPGHISQPEQLWRLPLEHSISVQTYTKRGPICYTQSIAPKSAVILHWHIPILNWMAQQVPAFLLIQAHKH